MAGNWSELPPDLLVSIGERLGNWINILRLRSTCVSWRRSVPPFQKSPSMPYAILHPYIPHPLSALGDQPPASLTSTTIYRLEPLRSPPNSPPNKPWFMKVRLNHQKQKMILLNPSRYNEIAHLPLTFPESIDLSLIRITQVHQSFSLRSYFEHAALLSTGFGVVVAYISFNELVIENPRHEWWNRFCRIRFSNHFCSIANFKEKIYALDSEGDCVVFVSYLKRTRLTAPVGLITDLLDQKYLVESGGELLMVNRYAQNRDSSPTLAKGFQVYKLNNEGNGWEQVRSIGNRVLVVGSDCSYSVSAEEFGGWQSNCIVFMDDYFLRKEKYRELHCECGDCEMKALISPNGCYPEVIWPPPGWFLLPMRSIPIRRLVDRVVAFLQWLDWFCVILFGFLFFGIIAMIREPV